MQKPFSDPLVASIREHIAAEQKPSSHRIAPPTATQIATVHELPKRRAEVVAKKMANGRYPDEFKAKIVARALKGRDSGTESVASIAKDIKVRETLIYQWIKNAKGASGANGAAPRRDGGRKSNGASKSHRDVQTVAKELSDMMAKVNALKGELRQLLE